MRQSWATFAILGVGTEPGPAPLAKGALSGGLRSEQVPVGARCYISPWQRRSPESPRRGQGLPSPAPSRLGKRSQCSPRLPREEENGALLESVRFLFPDLFSGGSCGISLGPRRILCSSCVWLGLCLSCVRVWVPVFALEKDTGRTGAIISNAFLSLTSLRDTGFRGCTLPPTQASGPLGEHIFIHDTGFKKEGRKSGRERTRETDSHPTLNCTWVIPSQTLLMTASSPPRKGESQLHCTETWGVCRPLGQDSNDSWATAAFSLDRNHFFCK